MIKENELEHLENNWGKSGFCLNKPWVDTSGLPTTISELESALRDIPQNKVFVRIPEDKPSTGILPRVDLGNPGELEQRLQEGPLHVLGLNLQQVSEPFEKFIESFIERISPVLDHHGVRNKIETSVGVFLSSPNCIVPYHADPEHNFLFHLIGEKKFHIFPNNDLELFPSINREQNLTGSKNAILPYIDSFQEKATTFHLNPGMSTYQPPLAPHWVSAGDSIAVSVAVSVYTSAEKDVRRLHLFNSYLRKLGLKPTAAGENEQQDKAKQTIARVLQKTKQIAQRKPSINHFD